MAVEVNLVSRAKLCARLVYGNYRDLPYVRVSRNATFTKRSNTDNCTTDGQKVRRFNFAACASIAQQQDAEVETSPLHSRERLRARAAIHTFKIRGVSFGDRQTPVKGLETSEAIMMVPEPENDFDSGAIAIKKLNGLQLGYVPKEINSRPEFLQGVLFGHIKSSGPAIGTDPNLHGASVVYQPLLPPLHVVPGPERLQGVLQDISPYLTLSSWQELCNHALTKAQGRCQITKAPCNFLSVAPTWLEDTKRQTFVLTGLVCMAPALLGACQQLAKKTTQQEAVWTLQSINGWISSEIEAYMEYLQRLRTQRSKETWELDMSWLDQHGIKNLQWHYPYMRPGIAVE